jgi:modulator of FtsH protease
LNQAITCDPCDAGITSVGERSRVLRTTYCLLALSMVPTGPWLANGPGLGTAASAGTAAIFPGMVMLSSVVKRHPSSMGKFLFIGVIMLLLTVAGLANFFIQSSALMMTLAVLAIGIFSAFIPDELKRAQDGHGANHMIATLGNYHQCNVFQSRLAMPGRAGGRDE